MGDPLPFTPKQRLGGGASGEVWLATGPGGDVALKIAAPGHSLAQEIGAMARISHPLVPKLLGADREGAWLARTFVQGQRLTSWAHGRTLSERVGTFGKLCSAVQAVHDAGLIHGDLSPSNVLVDDRGLPHLLDIGSDARGGALGWMAPERLRGDSGGVASDVYGLGTLLYALLTGRPPYDRGGAAHFGWTAVSTLPLPPSALVPDLPTGLEEAVLSALAWSPICRPGSAAALGALASAGAAGARGRPVVGLLDERERLRRVVIDALRGECAVVVAHGPPGSGRMTLLREAAKAGAREGLLVREVAPSLLARSLTLAREGEVLLVDAEGSDAPALVAALDRATDAAMILIRSSQPLLGSRWRDAVQIRPAPLSRAEVAVLGASLGASLERMQLVWERSGGRSGLAARILRGEPPNLAGLDQTQAKLLRRLEQGPSELPELADLASLTEHQTLDALDLLFVRGLAWSSPDGGTLHGLAPG